MELKHFLKTTDKYAQILDINWIKNIKDFFLNFPRTHEDRSNIKTISQIFLDWSLQSVRWKIIKKTLITTPRGKKLLELIFQDEDGVEWKIQFFNAWFIVKNIKTDTWYVIIGKPKFERQKMIFWHPEMIETAAPDTDTGETNEWDFKSWRLYPVYTEISGISTHRFAKKIRDNLDKIPDYFTEYLPENFLEKYDLMEIRQTIKSMHYPENIETSKKAKYRFFFEKLLKLQLLSIINKIYYTAWTLKKKSDPDREIIKEFQTFLKFQLTNAQKKAIKHIVDDFHGGDTMMRLLQWDVWSGKTIVALAGAFYMYQKFGWQTAILAPTEVLANQHIQSISKVLLPNGINIALLTGSTPPKQKEKIKQDLKDGKISVVVGTHALLQEDIDFKNLKFAVIDEQHKFGVMQRSFFKKFDSPHILQMTATPIPRSLALAFFGEFEVSVIDEMPAGRKPVHTKIINEKEFEKLKQWILTKISQNQRIYLITPLIEESEKMDELASAVSEYEYIQKFLPEIREEIWLLHGKMRAKDKEEVMQNFKKWKIKFLISTTVIEVWIDVPEATIIVIKNAERFGLSQLHQLRWRVWRSDIQSYCFLITKSKSWDTYQRLKAMEDTNDGFKLAEIDMQMRGSGEILGVKQSGDTDLPIEILTDMKLLEKVKESALDLLAQYPELNWLESFKMQFVENNTNILI